jgi:hypothetical protein
MSDYIRPWKQLAFCLCLLASLGCKKSSPVDNKPEEVPKPPVLLNYEVISNNYGISYFGNPFISDLKVKDGSDIGYVEVGNDTANLYLTYNLASGWYLTNVQSYAGAKAAIPSTPEGNPDPAHFPGKQSFDPCALRSTLTFRIPLKSITSNPNGQCSVDEYFIAMKAMVRNITSPADCASGVDVDAWAAPVLINPGNSDEWATAFYYCKQIYTPWCPKSQGYWFSKPGLEWCQPVSFGNLTATKDEGRALWPAKDNWIRRVFFQASALQLSKVCENGNRAIPSSVIADYNKLYAFLSTITLAEIQRGSTSVPISTTDIDGYKKAADNISKWICQNHCTGTDDPAACAP